MELLLDYIINELQLSDVEALTFKSIAYKQMTQLDIKKASHFMADESMTNVMSALDVLTGCLQEMSNEV